MIDPLAANRPSTLNIYRQTDGWSDKEQMTGLCNTLCHSGMSYKCYRIIIHFVSSPKSPAAVIFTTFGKGTDIHDIITCAKFLLIN